MPSVLGSDGKPVSEISLSAGTTLTFDVDAYSGHKLETPCLDKDVATVSLNGNKLTVNAISEGSTIFGVYDVQNRRLAIVEVTVTAEDQSDKMVMLSETVGDTKYEIYKEIIDKNDYRENYKGWKNEYLHDR